MSQHVLKELFGFGLTYVFAVAWVIAVLSAMCFIGGILL